MQIAVFARKYSRRSGGDMRGPSATEITTLVVAAGLAAFGGSSSLAQEARRAAVEIDCNTIKGDAAAIKCAIDQSIARTEASRQRTKEIEARGAAARAIGECYKFLTTKIDRGEVTYEQVEKSV